MLLSLSLSLSRMRIKPEDLGTDAVGLGFLAQDLPPT